MYHQIVGIEPVIYVIISSSKVQDGRLLSGSILSLLGYALVKHVKNETCESKADLEFSLSGKDNKKWKLPTERAWCVYYKQPRLDRVS